MDYILNGSGDHDENRNPIKNVSDEETFVLTEHMVNISQELWNANMHTYFLDLDTAIVFLKKAEARIRHLSSILKDKGAGE